MSAFAYILRCADGAPVRDALRPTDRPGRLGVVGFQQIVRLEPDLDGVQHGRRVAGVAADKADEAPVPVEDWRPWALKGP